MLEIQSLWGDTVLDVRYEESSAIALPHGQVLVVREGALAYRMREVRMPRLISPPFLDRLDYRWINVLILAAFVHAALIVASALTPRTSGLDGELVLKNTRFIEARWAPAKSRRSIALGGGVETHASVKPASGPAGRRGTTSRGDIHDIAARVLGRIGEIAGKGDVLGELDGVLRGVRGRDIADGSGGLTTRGDGPGSGSGLSSAPVVLGALKGIGDFGRALPGRDLIKSDVRTSPSLQGSPTIMGSLDKEVIRTVIRDHINQIRYCYERSLMLHPETGKLTLEFTIGADGGVTRANWLDSSMDTEVSECVIARALKWRFPKPRGGGIVVVRYPIVFHAVG
jgi:TonB family protein